MSGQNELIRKLTTLIPVDNINIEYSENVTSGLGGITWTNPGTFRGMRGKSLNSANKNFSNFFDASNFLYNAIASSGGSSMRSMVANIKVQIKNGPELFQMVPMRGDILTVDKDMLLGNFMLPELLKHMHNNLKNREQMIDNKFLEEFAEAIFSASDPHVVDELNGLLSNSAQQIYGPVQVEMDMKEPDDQITFSSGNVYRVGDTIKVKKRHALMGHEYEAKAKIEKILKERRLFKVRNDSGVGVFRFQDVIV